MRFDKREFTKILEENKGIIHKVSLLYADNPEDRADLFQEICFQLWRSYGSYREDARFSTWMYRVAINTAISQIRKRKKDISKEEYYSQNHTSYTTDTYEERDQKEKLFRAISKLNKIDKAIIMLWLEEKKYEEIAEIMGISKSNVSVKLVRIKLSLAEKLKGSEK
ncbi:MAG: sigma-70 family RNA polymerase sigma factor [Bacteroidales bacterium]|nr:sigma-70 family RNA polymerase sigma factor [Candidatus Latescibacterota bacterium]